MSNNFSLVDIGNTLKLREEIDQGNKVTSWFRQGLNVVDLLPAKFKLDFFKENTTTPVFQIYNYGDDGKSPVSGFHIYNDPSKIFQNKCIAYGLEPHTAIRLWITGESTFQEEISNEYSTNLLEEQINGIVSKIAGPSSSSLVNIAKQSILKGGSSGQSRSGLSKALQDAVQNKLVDPAKTLAATLTNNNELADGMFNAAGKIANLFIRNTLQYSMLSMPKTFSNSSYNPSLNFNVRLISPYGYPTAIQTFIIDPLIYLLLLASPTTKDGLTYGGVSYVTVKAYGISDMPLAIIDNISIRRGGADVAYNKYRQPLSLDINVSIKPAATGLASYLEEFESSTLNKHETNHDNGVKVATDMTAPIKGQAFDSTGAILDSPMTTIGNILESFKPMNADGLDNINGSDSVQVSPLTAYPNSNARQFADKARTEQANQKTQQRRTKQAMIIMSTYTQDNTGF